MRLPLDPLLLRARPKVPDRHVGRIRIPVSNEWLSKGRGGLGIEEAHRSKKNIHVCKENEPFFRLQYAPVVEQYNWAGSSSQVDTWCYGTGLTPGRS